MPYIETVIKCEYCDYDYGNRNIQGTPQIDYDYILEKFYSCNNCQTEICDNCISVCDICNMYSCENCYNHDSDMCADCYKEAKSHTDNEEV